MDELHLGLESRYGSNWSCVHCNEICCGNKCLECKIVIVILTPFCNNSLKMQKFIVIMIGNLKICKTF
jgi:hypothetical protein